jgi:hypothetical protein
MLTLPERQHRKLRKKYSSVRKICHLLLIHAVIVKFNENRPLQLALLCRVGPLETERLCVKARSCELHVT